MNPLTATTTKQGRQYVWPTGDKLPSVTTIAKELTSPQLMFWYAKQTAMAAIQSDKWHEMSEEEAVKHLSSEPTRQANDAAEVGIDAHAKISRQLDERASIADNWWEIDDPYVTAATKFLSETGLTAVATEKEIANTNLGYAGTVDLIAKDSMDNLWLIDWKTGKGVYPQHAMQMSAYLNADSALAVGEDDTLVSVPLPANWNVAIGAVVKINDRGKYQTYLLRNPIDCFNAFKACHYLYKFRQRSAWQ